MDIFERIINEHREVDQLLAQLSDQSTCNQAAFDQLALAIKAHVVAEEDSLYPAVIRSDKEFLDQAFREHAQVSMLLRKIGEAGLNDSEFFENIACLTAMIQDHVRKEEEMLIPMAKDILDQEEIDKLSEKFDQVGSRIVEKAR